jgi:hypothetical protein
VFGGVGEVGEFEVDGVDEILREEAAPQFVVAAL